MLGGKSNNNEGNRSILQIQEQIDDLQLLHDQNQDRVDSIESFRIKLKNQQIQFEQQMKDDWDQFSKFLTKPRPYTPSPSSVQAQSNKKTRDQRQANEIQKIKQENVEIKEQVGELKEQLEQKKKMMSQQLNSHTQIHIATDQSHLVREIHSDLNSDEKPEGFLNQEPFRSKQMRQSLDLDGVINMLEVFDEHKEKSNSRFLGIEDYRKKIELDEKLIVVYESIHDAQPVFDKLLEKGWENARYPNSVVLAKALKLFGEMNKREWSNDKEITASSLIVYEEEFAAVSIIMSSKWATSLEWPMNKVGKIFVEFVERESHVDWKSNPVVFVNDSTLLFANAGINKFKAIFLGTADHTSGPSKLKRSCKTQKCLRDSRKHIDLEDVGKDTDHPTFFEMLGNKPFGDYFTKEAIEWA